MRVNLPVTQIINNVLSPTPQGGIQNETVIGAYLKGKKKEIRFVTESLLPGYRGSAPTLFHSAIKFYNKKGYKKNTVFVVDYDFERFKTLFTSCTEGSNFQFKNVDYYKMTEKEVKQFIQGKVFYDGGTSGVLEVPDAKQFLKANGILI